MSRFAKITYSLLLALFFLLSANPVLSEDIMCFCSTLTNISPATADCFPYPPVGGCEVVKNSQAARNFNNCEMKDTAAECTAAKTAWTTARDAAARAAAQNSSNQDAQSTGLIYNAMNSCLFAERVAGDCRDISIFVEFAIKIGGIVFTVIGALALVMFIYGGFVMILSSGSSEKVKKGTDAMVAAVIGLVIVFSAYMLIKFLGTAVGLQGDFILR